MSEPLTYKGFEVKFNELRQRHVEKWRTAVKPQDGEENIPSANHQAVKAAFQTGWFETPVLSFPNGGDDPLMDWPPDRINWLAQQIMERYVEAMTISPS